MSMQRHTTDWDDELERRIQHYEELEQSQGIAGRLNAIDYGAMVAILLVLVGAFWSWGGV